MSIVNATSENFEELIKEEGAVIEFWAPWCGYCKRLAPVLKQMAQEYEELSLAQVNIDDEDALAQRYGIETIPSILVFHDGKPSDPLIAPQSKSQLVSWLKEQNALNQ